MFSLLLLLCCGLLADAQTMITYVGKILTVGAGPWAPGDTLMVNFTLAEGATGTSSGSSNSTISSGTSFDWGFSEGETGTSPLVFSSVQLTLMKGISAPTAFNRLTITNDPTLFNALSLSVTAPSSISLYLEASTSGMSQLPAVAGFQINTISIDQNFGFTWPTTVSEVSSFFASVASPTPKTPASSAISDTITYSSGSSGSTNTLTLQPVSLTISVPVAGAAEVPIMYEDEDSLKSALSALGITFGAWDTSVMKITFTGVLVQGTLTFAVYTSSDDELGPIVVTLGTMKVKNWGNGVKKGAMGFLKPSDLKRATGLSFTIPAGLSEVLYACIKRFDDNDNEISKGSFTFEVSSSTLMTYFRHYLTGDKKGKRVGSEDGTLGACATASTGCFEVMISSTSSVAGLTGSNGAATLNVWFATVALVPALFLVLW